MPLRRCGSVRARFTVWSTQRCGEGASVGVERFDASGIERVHRLFPADQVEGGALLGGGLRQQECPGREVESGESHLGRHLGAARTPPQAAGDHQMKHEVKVFIEVEDDALAHTPGRRDAPAVNLAQRRIERTNEEGARDAHLRELLAEDPPAQVEQIDFDVGQLRHGDDNRSAPPRRATLRVRGRTGRR